MLKFFATRLARHNSALDPSIDMIASWADELESKLQVTWPMITDTRSSTTTTTLTTGRSFRYHSAGDIGPVSQHGGAAELPSRHGPLHQLPA